MHIGIAGAGLLGRDGAEGIERERRAARPECAHRGVLPARRAGGAPDPALTRRTPEVHPDAALGPRLGVHYLLT